MLTKETRIDCDTSDGGYVISRSYWCEERQQRFWETIEPEAVVDALEGLRKLCKYDSNCRDYFVKELTGLGLFPQDFEETPKENTPT